MARVSAARSEPALRFRRPVNVAAVAVVHKTTRALWAMIRREEEIEILRCSKPTCQASIDPTSCFVICHAPKDVGTIELSGLGKAHGPDADCEFLLRVPNLAIQTSDNLSGSNLSAVCRLI